MKVNELGKALAGGIRRCRRANGMTIEQLAEAAGMDAGYLAHIETGSKNPSLPLLDKLVRALRVPPQELLSSDRPTSTPRQTAAERQILVRLGALKPARRADLLAIISKLRHGDQIRGLRLLLKA